MSGRARQDVPRRRGAPSSAITEEQFLRGIAAIRRHETMVKAMSVIVAQAGCSAHSGYDPAENLCSELTRQLEERCNDQPDRYGSMITYMLYECGGPIIEPDGTARMVNTPQLLWQYWRDHGGGPFRNTPSTTGPTDREEDHGS